MEWIIPQTTQCYTRRDTALYALSVGLGQRANDERQLNFIDPWSEQLTALPTMALVLAYPGYWLGAPEVERATGISSGQILHVSQAVELHATLPTEGDVVSDTKVTGIVDKGRERGSLLHSERRIHNQANGALVAICRQTHFLRGAGGFGNVGDAEPVPEPIPSGEPDFIVQHSTRPEQALLYRLNGDQNPLHINWAAAHAAGFNKPLLHGMCTIGIVLHGVLDAAANYESCLIRSFELQMSAPVFPGDSIRTEIWKDGTFRARVMERDSLVVDRGRAMIGAPELCIG